MTINRTTGNIVASKMVAVHFSVVTEIRVWPQNGLQCQWRDSKRKKHIFSAKIKIFGDFRPRLWP